MKKISLLEFRGVVSRIPSICIVACIINLHAVAGGTEQSPPLGTNKDPDLPSLGTEHLYRMPLDVDESLVRQLVTEGKVIEAHRQFDLFSWQMFLALNWPATPQGTADEKKDLHDTAAPRVWSYWHNADTIFKQNGAPPDEWNLGDQQRNAEQGLYSSKAAWRQSKTSAEENFQAFSGPLVDQNGKWVRYEVMVNKREFDYLKDNGLYNLAGQVKFSQGFVDAEGKYVPPKQAAFPANEGEQAGAIEVKLAWKQLGPNDDPDRFYTTSARIKPSEPANGADEANPPEVRVGLVGMHIAMRTRSSPEWIWSTFEQVDNVAVDPHATTKDGRPLRPSFHNPDDATTPPNILPPANARIDAHTGLPVREDDPAKATTWIESRTTQPVQVTRVVVPPQADLNRWDATLAATTDTLNQDVAAKLGQMGSVFRYYKLIGTQWPLHPDAPAFAGGERTAPESIAHKTPGDMVPVFLVNTTMETYFQKGSQHAGPLEQDDRLVNNAEPIDHTPVFATESCVGCHYSAGVCIGFKKNMDGTDATNPDTGWRVPVYGENSHFGKTGNGAFSWLLQIRTQNQRPPSDSEPVPAKAAPVNRPANQLDFKKLLQQRAPAQASINP